MGNQLELIPPTKYQLSDKLKEQLGSWTCLYPFFESEAWQRIKAALKPDLDQLTPEIEVWFRAFKECDINKLSVVWLGLSPYFSKDNYTKNNIADGLAFSTDTKHAVPPSLFQVYKGLEWDKWKGMNLEMQRYNKLDFLANQVAYNWTGPNNFEKQRTPPRFSYFRKYLTINIFHLCNYVFLSQI